MPEISINATSSAASRCPLCGEGLAEGEVRTCPGCQVGYHSECLVELGGCGTLGCSHAKRSGPISLPARAGSSDQPALWIGAVVLCAFLALVWAAFNAKSTRHPPAYTRPGPALPAPSTPFAPAPNGFDDLAPNEIEQLLQEGLDLETSGPRFEFLTAAARLVELARLERSPSVEILRAREIGAAREAYRAILSAEAERSPDEIRAILEVQLHLRVPNQRPRVAAVLDEILTPVKAAGPGD